MSVLKMKKVSLAGLKKDRKNVLEKLQSLGVMEITPAPQGTEALSKMDTAGARQAFERNVSLCENALEILNEAAPEKTGMLSGLAGPEQLTRGEFGKTVVQRDRVMDIVQEITRTNRAIQENNSQIQKMENQIESLVPWLPLSIPMNFAGTNETRALLGTFPPEETKESIEALLAEKCEGIPYELTVVSSDKDALYLCVITLTKDEAAVEEALRSKGFAKPSLAIDTTPKKETELLTSLIGELKKTNEQLTEKIVSLADHKEEIRRTSDHFRTRAEKYSVLGTLPQSENTFFVTGYVPEKAVAAVRAAVEEPFGCYMEVEDPAADEEVPVLLSNNKFSRNLEGITSSYGLPGKTDIDPTAIMSVFYVFFFGMMLSDAAYGLIIALACFIVLKKNPHMAEGMRKSLTMFMYCGVSTLVWGVLYGGYFGDAPTVIADTFFHKTVKVPAVWFEPLGDPMRLLMYCLLFGLIHLFVGLGIKGYQLLREGDKVGFVADVLAWFLFLIGLIFLLLPTSIFESISQIHFVFPAPVNLLAKVFTIAGMVLILLMSGRSSKNWALRIALGAYDIYGTTSWLSDVLSYARLLALGLATGVIASVINMLAGMVAKDHGIIGALLFIIIFIAGHVLNLGINMLGAYVHTNRLQYAEFFSKFYDAGGEPFVPFKETNKYVEIKEGK